MTKYVLLQSLGFFILAIAATALLFIIFYTVSKNLIWQDISRFPPPFWLLAFFAVFSPQIFPQYLKYPFFLKTFGPAGGPGTAPEKYLHFFKNIKNFEKVDIAKTQPIFRHQLAETIPKKWMWK